MAASITFNKKDQIIPWIDKLYQHYSTTELKGSTLTPSLDPRSTVTPSLIMTKTLSVLTRQLYNNFMKHAETKIDDMFDEYDIPPISASSITPSTAPISASSITPSTAPTTASVITSTLINNYKILANVIFSYLWQLYKFNEFVTITVEELKSLYGEGFDADVFKDYYSKLYKIRTDEEKNLSSTMSSIISRTVARVTTQLESKAATVITPQLESKSATVTTPKLETKTTARTTGIQNLPTALITNILGPQLKVSELPALSMLSKSMSKESKALMEERKRCYNESYHNMRCLSIMKQRDLEDNWQQESKCVDYCNSVRPEKKIAFFWRLVDLSLSGSAKPSGKNSDDKRKYNEFISIIDTLPTGELLLLEGLWESLIDKVGDLTERSYGKIMQGIDPDEEDAIDELIGEEHGVRTHIISLGEDYVKYMLNNRPKSIVDYFNKYGDPADQGSRVVDSLLFTQPIDNKIYRGSARANPTRGKLTIKRSIPIVEFPL